MSNSGIRLSTSPLLTCVYRYCSIYIFDCTCIRLRRLHRMDIYSYISLKAKGIFYSSINVLKSLSRFHACHILYYASSFFFFLLLLLIMQLTNDIKRGLKASDPVGCIATFAALLLMDPFEQRDNWERQKKDIYIICIIIDGIPVLFIFSFWARNMIRFINHTFALFQRCRWKEQSILYRNLNQLMFSTKEIVVIIFSLLALCCCQ